MNTLALPPGTDLLRLQSADPARFPLLLESVAGGNALSRWDLLLATDGEGLRLDVDGHVRSLGDGALVGQDFLQELDARWAQARQPAGDPALPFQGGWALFLAYELAAQVEARLQLPLAPGPLPVAIAWRCPAAVLRDRDSGLCLAVAEAGSAHWLDLLAGAAMAPAPGGFAVPTLEEDPPAHFTDGVARIHDYLRAGDVFQVNLSRAWRARFDAAPDPGAVYARLRENNPAPFAGLMRVGEAALLSSSPERLVSVRGRRVDTRPIAGTRPRGRTSAHDAVGSPSNT